MNNNKFTFFFSILVATFFLAFCSPKVEKQPIEKKITFDMPSEDTIPDNEMGDYIRLGRELVSDTYNMLPDNVGNKLHCTSCHLYEGTAVHGLPWVGSSAVYPRYRKRSASVVSMHERINGCFRRSLNGKGLPLGSKEMGAIVAYIKWLSRGVPIGEYVENAGLVKIDENLVPDKKNGERVFKLHCASCHGLDGSGQYPNGEYVYPAVAGPNSFNDGAGMARTYKAAAFVYHNMPFELDKTLTMQDAVDVAEYFTRLPRPVFAHKDKDWPKGGRPKDARE